MTATTDTPRDRANFTMRTVSSGYGCEAEHEQRVVRIHAQNLVQQHSFLAFDQADVVFESRDRASWTSSGSREASRSTPTSSRIASRLAVSASKGAMVGYRVGVSHVSPRRREPSGLSCRACDAGTAAGSGLIGSAAGSHDLYDGQPIYWFVVGQVDEVCLLWHCYIV